jgi:hypothetical protein
MMGLWNVVAAAAASWVFGMIWYRALSGPWIGAAGLSGKANAWRGYRSDLLPVILSALTMIVVAGFMRHVFFVSGLTENVPLGLVAGMGVGLFFIAPWTMLDNFRAGRPLRLTLIDGGYATFGCAIMGALLVAY